MIGNILRFGRRQLHTIISREIIKPTSPTPSHLQTYNLSQIDQLSPHYYVPVIFFYSNKKNSCLTADEKAQKLKKSLSQSLTQYYPFAGRLHTPTTTHVDCNDEGVVFVEAKNDSQLDKFQHMREEDASFGQLFADDMRRHKSPHRNASLVGVQITHFACGGVAVALSSSYRIADGCTVGSFMSYWASVARYGSTDHKEVLPLTPQFIQSPPTTVPFMPSYPKCESCVTITFVFPNSKLNELKNKVLAEAGSTQSVNKLTRVEVLSSLLYKTTVAAVSQESGSFKPSILEIYVDMRKNFVPKLPQTTAGNVITLMKVTAQNECETSLGRVVSEIKKGKMALEGVQSAQQLFQKVESSHLGSEDPDNGAIREFWCSSFCGFPYNKVDFGWGKPISSGLELGTLHRPGFMLMDTPDKDGIQAQVLLEKQHVEIFKNDKELLSFCQTNLCI